MHTPQTGKLENNIHKFSSLSGAGSCQQTAQNHHHHITSHAYIACHHLHTCFSAMIETTFGRRAKTRIIALQFVRQWGRHRADVPGGNRLTSIWLVLSFYLGIWSRLTTSRDENTMFVVHRSRRPFRPPHPTTRPVHRAIPLPVCDVFMCPLHASKLIT